jgi:hypothetical protein
VIGGGGAAGISCALAAAQQGKQVILVEKTGSLGGTLTQALIHTIGGLFDEHGQLLNLGLPLALVERLTHASPATQKRRIGKLWVLNVDPAIYAAVVTAWVAEFSKINILYHTELTEIFIEDQRASQIKLNGQWIKISALVDATGTAQLIRHIDPKLVKADNTLAGWIVQIRGITPNALQFPQGVAILKTIRDATVRQQLPPECATVWLDSGVYADEIYLKFNLPISADLAHLIPIAEQLLTFLQQFPALSQAKIHSYGQLGIREDGRVIGEYCLTEADVKSGQTFTDAACWANWAIEHWHVTTGLSLEYLQHAYQIPLRSCKVAGFANVWAVGKCLSAEPRAQASARVVGTCWAMGAAVGTHLGRIS